MSGDPSLTYHNRCSFLSRRDDVRKERVGMTFVKGLHWRPRSEAAVIYNLSTLYFVLKRLL